jgi:NAD(P)-dependent dehydrogenase (short-subunit alcohol dehydrogenase family)
MVADARTPLAGRVAIVTGGASGIGRATCLRFARAGAIVVVADVDAARVDDAVRELDGMFPGVESMGISADVRDESAMSALVQQVTRRFERIDILVHSAGVLRPQDAGLQILRDITAAGYDHVIGINLKGTLVTNRAVLPAMIKQRSGIIVNLSSTSGRIGRAFDSVYCASKFGVLGLTESLADEMRGYGIKVLAVLPDAIDTPMWDQNGPIRAPEEAIPPDRVAREIEYLVSLPGDTMIKELVISPFRKRKRKPRRPASSDQGGESETAGKPGLEGDAGDLTGQVAIVTGGTGGLGRPTCIRLAEAGASVVVVARTESAIQELVDQVAAINGAASAMGVIADVTRESDVSQMTGKVLERFGRIDILVNFAGILRASGTLKSIVDVSVGECDQVIDTNLKGTFLCNRSVLRTMMKQNSGNIINVSSTSGTVGRAFDSPYCASKFGMVGMTESLGEEVHQYGIKTFVVLPDVFKTPIWEQNGPIRAPGIALPPERLAGVIHHLVTLPPDTILGRVAVGPFRGRKRKKHADQSQFAVTEA